MKKLFFLTILVFSFVVLKAQVPGYLGKRLIFNFNYAAFPALSNNATIRQTGNIGLNQQFGGELEYVVSRRVSLVGGYRYLHMGDRGGYYGYRFNDITAGIKLFGANSIAPLGTFHKFELGVAPGSLVLYNPSTQTVNKEANLLGLNFIYTFGFNRIFFNRWIISGGMQYGILLPTPNNNLNIQNYALNIIRPFNYMLYNIYIGTGVLLY
jgi:hypothetical protein